MVLWRDKRSGIHACITSLCLVGTAMQCFWDLIAQKEVIICPGQCKQSLNTWNVKAKRCAILWNHRQLLGLFLYKLATYHSFSLLIWLHGFESETSTLGLSAGPVATYKCCRITCFKTVTTCDGNKHMTHTSNKLVSVPKQGQCALTLRIWCVLNNIFEWRMLCKKSRGLRLQRTNSHQGGIWLWGHIPPGSFVVLTLRGCLWGL